MSGFEGFSPETVDFLWGIRMNNNKEWFTEHKPEYVKYLYEPMKDLGKDLYTILEDRPWIHDRKTLGGGQLFSHGCHYIDLMIWMLGKPKSGVHMGTKCCTPWMDREGTSNVCLEFENGALGYHFGTWGARGSSHVYNFQVHTEHGFFEYKHYDSITEH